MIWGTIHMDKKSEKNIRCVYTCITGNYDALIIPKCINQNYDYVCYTDSEILLMKKHAGPWEIRPLLHMSKDITRTSRWHKINGYRYLGDYISSIWIDANINIITDCMYAYFSQEFRDLVVPIHSDRDCIYQEIDACRSLNLDDETIILEMLSKLVDDGMPQHFGLNDTSLIYRKHNTVSVDSLMDEWWYYVLNYSKRDQLSFTYLLWKHGVSFVDIAMSNIRIDHDNFQFYPHLPHITPIHYVLNIMCKHYSPFRPVHTGIDVCRTCMRRIFRRSVGIT